MARTSVVVGREAGCEVRIDHPTVSARHARILLTKKGLLIEDLSSSNGTFVAGERIRQAKIRPGDDVVVGQVSLPWSHEALRPFVRASAGRTLPIQEMKGGGARIAATQKGRNRRRFSEVFLWIALICASFVTAWVVWIEPSLASHTNARGERVRQAVRDAAGNSAEAIADLAGLSPQEAAVRIRTAPKVSAAIDVTNPITRNTAVKLAAKSKGPFHVEQVVEVWFHAYKRWRYVNDPKGEEYFAKASESIDNDYAGDCDDFATLVSAMIEAVGGEARVVMMESEKGGHAYAETRVKGSLKELQSALDRFARRNLKKRVLSVHARPSEPVDGVESHWLNLDWNAQVPGGPYENEKWAVAIYPDGSTRQLAAAQKEASK